METGSEATEKVVNEECESFHKKGEGAEEET